MNAGQACLLAAGRGRRMGGPKAWLIHAGRPLLERQVEFLLGLFPPGKIAVSIQQEWSQRCLSIHRDVAWIPVDAQSPPLAALQELLRWRPPDGWAFLHHVDMPVWEKGLFEALDAQIPAAEALGAQAVSPVRGGRGGHPVLLSPGCAAELRAADPREDRLDFWLRRRTVHAVEADFPCVHLNLNAPEDLAGL